ncbi:hypothetical protein Tco_0525953 [Tanacetum coccineum]
MVCDELFMGNGVWLSTVWACDCVGAEVGIGVSIRGHGYRDVGLVGWGYMMGRTWGVCSFMCGQMVRGGTLVVINGAKHTLGFTILLRSTRARKPKLYAILAEKFMETGVVIFATMVTLQGLDVDIKLSIHCAFAVVIVAKLMVERVGGGRKDVTGYDDRV